MRLFGLTLVFVLASGAVGGAEVWGEEGGDHPKTIEFGGREISYKEALPVLKEALAGDDTQAQLKALEALERIFRDDKTTLESAKKDSELVRRLEEIYRNAGPLPRDEKELKNDDERRLAYAIKFQGLCVAGTLNKDVGMRLLADALKSENKLVRAAGELFRGPPVRVSLVLRDLDRDQVLVVVRTLLATRDVGVRAKAARALGGVAKELGEDALDSVVDTLTTAYEKESEFVCRFAIVRAAMEAGFEAGSVQRFLQSVASSQTESEQIRKLAADAIEYWGQSPVSERPGSGSR